MDLENELRKFANSDMPYRQTRENIALTLALANEDGSGPFAGVVENLSKGGVRALIQAKTIPFLKYERVIIKIRWLQKTAEEAGEIETDDISAQVMWLESDEKDHWIVGCRFLELSETVVQRIERHLMSNIIKRNIKEE